MASRSARSWSGSLRISKTASHTRASSSVANMCLVSVQTSGPFIAGPADVIEIRQPAFPNCGIGNQGVDARFAACDTTRHFPEGAPSVRAPTGVLNRFSGGVYPLAGHTRVRHGYGNPLLFGFPSGSLLLAVGFAVRPTLGDRGCGLTLAASSPMRRSPVRIRPLLQVRQEPSRASQTAGP
jgi:hypothetical protein